MSDPKNPGRRAHLTPDDTQALDPRRRRGDATGRTRNAPRQDKQSFPMLLVLTGPQADSRFLINRAQARIGRSEACEVFLADSQVSRVHAIITHENIGQPGAAPVCIVRDNNSTNGTYVNDKPVKMERLKDRDRLMVGRTVLGFSVVDTLELDADTRLFHRATTDALTGLRNRRAFDATLPIEVARSRRYGRPLTLMMLDIDHFKHINDRHGHPAGDETLRLLARIVQSQTRESDIACRYGGEEIVIILPETDQRQACEMAQRLRAIVEQAALSVNGVGIQFTISLGIAELGAGAQTPETLLALVDAALYRAKQGGRNRVEAASADALAPPLFETLRIKPNAAVRQPS